MATFYERNKAAIQCTLGGLLGGMALGALLMYARTATGTRMRKSVKKASRRAMKFSDLYPDDTTPGSNNSTPTSVNSLYSSYKAKYGLK